MSRDAAPPEPYGVLCARPETWREDRHGASPHFQILLRAGRARFRAAVNVQSHDGSDLLYRIDEDFRHPMLAGAAALPEGFTALPRAAGTGALDYIRGNLFDPRSLRYLPAHTPGRDNDLNDLLALHLRRAVDDSSAMLFVYGMAWRPSRRAADPVFGFRPARGLHNIHMNQGNPPGRFADDNGVWQDGGLLLRFPGAERWVAVFLAFANQSWHTDDRTGHPVGGATGAEPRRFDPEGRLLPAEAQRRPDIAILAVRGEAAGPAVLLLNLTTDDVDLTGWTLAAGPAMRLPLDGPLPAGQTRLVEVPAGFLAAAGGVLTLLDAGGLKVAGVAYPAGVHSRSRWIRLR